MARPPSSAGGRPVVVAVRLTNQEAQDLDRRRGALTRGEWIRWLLTRARNSDVRLEDR